MDPCAGKGIALTFLGKTLDIPDENVYAVELSESRTNDLRRDFPKMKILGPASFMGTGISYNAYSLAYVNPPYSDEMGGGRREELTFLVKAINHLTPGGVMVLVVPEPTVYDWGSGADAMRRALSCRLEGISVFQLPDEHRNFREIVVFGRKRKHAVPEGDGPLGKDAHWWESKDKIGILGQPTTTYRLPPGKAPKRWEQTDFTPEELLRKVLASPLSQLLKPPRPSEAPAPPLPPSKGHTALILASGDLDGLVWPSGEPPHVVRGTSRKITYRDEAKCESKHNEDGSSSQKEVYSEKITLVVRAVSVDGKIHTFTDNTAAEATPDAMPHHDNSESDAG